MDGTVRVENVLNDMVKTALRFSMFSFPGLHRIPVLLFGRRQPFTYAMPVEHGFEVALADDARLFLTTFAGGLLFMTVYLA